MIFMDNTEKSTDKVYYTNITKQMYECAVRLRSTGMMSDATFAQYEKLCCRPSAQNKEVPNE